MAEIETQFSSREIAEWVAFASLEPFGEERADMRAGIIASVMANVHRDSKKRIQPFTPADFMPFLEREPADHSLSRQVRATFSTLRKRKR